MLDEEKEKRKKIINAVVNSDDYYKDNEEAKERLEKSLEEVEAIQKGKLPKRPARELLNDLRAEASKEQITEIFKKCVNQYGDLLKRLDD